MLAIGLIIFGVVVVGGSFAFAAVNMGKAASSMFGENNSSDLFSGFGGMFKRHIGAMVGMMLGGLISTIGVVIGIVQIVQLFLAK